MKLNRLQSGFAKYDKDKDSLLSSKEVKAYAQGEFNFALPPQTVQSIMTKLGGEAGKGVPKARLQSLKVQIGLARDVVRNEELRSSRLKREELLESQKEELKEGVEKAMLA